MKLWGGRFEGQPSEVFERFSRSLDVRLKQLHVIDGAEATRQRMFPAVGWAPQ